MNSWRRLPGDSLGKRLLNKRILFVCSRNRFRSLTAQEVFGGLEGIEVDSAGTEKDARVVVEPDHIEWADVIYVMEARHLKRLKEMFGPALKRKKMINLGIPDIYGFMDAGLIEVLRAKLPGLA
jgi:predicted protein tyrosine phosphatase